MLLGLDTEAIYISPAILFNGWAFLLSFFVYFQCCSLLISANCGQVDVNCCHLLSGRKEPSFDLLMRQQQIRHTL